MNTTDSRAFGVVLAAAVIAWAMVFAALAVVESRWWLLAAVPASLIGVIGMAIECSRAPTVAADLPREALPPIPPALLAKPEDALKRHGIGDHESG